MSLLDKVWHIYVGQSWVGTLTPTGQDGDWITADFNRGDAWGNFAPWFIQGSQAYHNGSEAAWQTIYDQLALMGLSIVADDGESYTSPTIITDGSRAWFAV